MAIIAEHQVKRTVAVQIAHRHTVDEGSFRIESACVYKAGCPVKIDLGKIGTYVAKNQVKRAIAVQVAYRYATGADIAVWVELVSEWSKDRVAVIQIYLARAIIAEYQVKRTVAVQIT